MKNAMQLKAIMKKLAKENQISAQLVLQNYMLERFLERVSLSPYRDNYIIKGGFLISSMVGLNSRATMDMDATIKGYPVTQDAVQKMIEQILTVPVDDDITFTFKSIGEIREGDEYTGYRVALTADFPPMAVPLKLDITTGDKITPREIQYDYKLMLEDRHIQVMAYNLATILAEKLETVISRSDQNTRPRDYYDVYILTKLQAENIDFPALGAALMATASKRGSDSILQDYTDFLAGSFVVCGNGGEDFISLTDRQVFLYERLYHNPVVFLPTPHGLLPMKCTPEQYEQFQRDGNKLKIKPIDHGDR